MPDSIEYEELLQSITKENNIYILDIRDDISFKEFSFRNSVNIPYSDVVDRITEIPKSKLIIVVCKWGNLARNIVAYLRIKGYNACYLAKGMSTLTDNLQE